MELKMTRREQKKQRFADTLTGVMLFIITGIMPLVVRAAIRPVPPEVQVMFGSAPFYADMFAYAKSWFLILPALAVFLYYISDAVTSGKTGIDLKALLRQPPVIAALVYLLMVWLSGVFSPFQYTAWLGTLERCEGVFAQTAYIAVFLMVLLYARDENFAKPLLYGLVFSSLIMGLIGAGQFLGHDFFNTDIGNILVAGQKNAVTTNFDMANGTLFNPNTYGMYSAMLAPFLLMGGIGYWGASRSRKTVSLLMLAGGGLMLLGVAGSRSVGGFIGAIAAAAVLAVTGIAYFAYQKKLPSVKAVAFAAVLLVMVAASVLWVGPINQRVSLLINRLQTGSHVSPRFADDFTFSQNGIVITDGNQQPLAFILPDVHDEFVIVTDRRGQIVEPAEIVSVENEYAHYYYIVPDYGQLHLQRFEEFFTFRGIFVAAAEGKLYPFMHNGMAINMDEPVATFGFEGRETWGSSRGYIWSRSLPLLLNYPILGSGPDTYVNVFPQTDVMGKLLYLSGPYSLVDKAHNLYLQTGITTGGLSLLALLFLLGHYMLGTFWLIVKQKNAPRTAFGLRLGLLAAVAAFATASLATDSTIASTGIFYVLLGLGYAVNRWGHQA
jgi:hypothetical protein